MIFFNWDDQQGEIVLRDYVIEEKTAVHFIDSETRDDIDTLSVNLEGTELPPDRFYVRDYGRYRGLAIALESHEIAIRVDQLTVGNWHSTCYEMQAHGELAELMQAHHQTRKPT